MARRTARWLATTAFSLLGSGSVLAQMPAGVVVSSPPPVTTVTTLEAGSVAVIPPFTKAIAPSMPMMTHQPAQGQYVLNPYFGYYQTQWRPFPGSPNCEPTGPIVLAPREITVPVLAPPTPVQPTPMPIPPAPMTIEPAPKPLNPEVPAPKPLNPEVPAPTPKTPDVIPPKPLMIDPLPPKKTDITPPKPLLFDPLKPKPSKVEPASTGPLLTPPSDVSHRDPWTVTTPLPGEGFAEGRTVSKPAPVVRVDHRTGPEIPLLPGNPFTPPVVQPPKKLATLGLPKPTPTAEDALPIIRSGDRLDDDTQRPQWPVIRNGTSPK